MNTWFLVLLLLGALNLGNTMSEHGKPKREKHNFWVSLFGVALQLFLIYMAVQTGF